MKYFGIYVETPDKGYRLVFAVNGRGMDIWHRASDIAQMLRVWSVESGIIVSNTSCDFATIYSMEFMNCPDDVLFFNLLGDEFQIWRHGDTPTSVSANGIAMKLKPGMWIGKIIIEMPGRIKDKQGTYQRFIEGVSANLGEETLVELWDGDLDFLRAGKV